MSSAALLPLELLMLASLVALGTRADIITLNSTSPRIQYQGSWSTGDDFRVSLNRTQTFAVLWSGTGIRVQGKIQGNQSAVLFSLDNSTTVAPPAPYLDWMIYAVSGLESGDHQLLMSRLPVNNIATNFYLYNIVLEREDLGQQSGTSLFDPSYMGTTATKVPSNATLIDDSWPGVQTSGKWTCWGNPQPTSSEEYWYNNTATETANEGDSLKFTFHGSSIWIFGTKYSAGGDSDVYVDGNNMGVINSYGYAVQDLLWSTEHLTDAKHELQIITRRCSHVCSGCEGACLSIDFFRILTSTTPYGATTDSPAPSSTDDGNGDGDYDRLSVRNVAAIIAGVVGGTFFVLLTSLGTFAWKRMFALS